MNNRGFTLVEILVAISIMAIIGTVAIPNLNQFNQDQLMQNTADDLVRILRQTQSSATSRTSCSPTLSSLGWNVVITGSSYQMVGQCYNPQATAFPTPAPINDVRYSPAPNLTDGMTFSSQVRYLDQSSNTTQTVNCSMPTTIIFNSEYQPYDQNRFTNIDFSCLTDLSPSVGTKTAEMMITITRGSDTQFVCIDKGGSIYGSAATPCF